MKRVGNTLAVWVLGPVLAASVFWATTPRAQSVKPDHVALLIGDWDYDLGGAYHDPPAPGFVSDLRNPCNDVSVVKKSLEANGFRIFDYCNDTHDAFDKHLSDFGSLTQSLPRGSVVFIYISGHGLQLHGHMFSVPVLFKWDEDSLQKMDADSQYHYIHDRANEINELFDKVSDDFDVALIIALDNCRDSPVAESVAYNESVSIRTPPNALVQYATTAGDTTSDGPGDNSDYALTLAEFLRKGGDAGDAMAGVSAQIWKRFRANERTSYAETNVGEAFKAMRFIPLGSASHPQASQPGQAVQRRKIVVRNVYDGVSVDVLWCEGDGESARFQYARELANRISSRSREFKVGRVQLKPLSEELNLRHGYNVFRNIMRYDFDGGPERTALSDIASAFPEAGFLPQRGVGAHGKTFHNYASIFVCGRVPV